MNFTEDEVKQIFNLAIVDNNFNPATDRSCNGTLYTLEKLETVGVKLIVSPIGEKDKLKQSNISDFIDSPCIWIGESGTGRWIGLQGGWPTDKGEIKEELEFDNAVIKKDRNRFPDPDIDRPVEFMYLERDKSSYFIPKPGWMVKAKRRIELYKNLRNRLPEFLAAKIARDVTFLWGEPDKPNWEQLVCEYVVRLFFVLLKILIVLLAAIELINIL